MIWKFYKNKYVYLIWSSSSTFFLLNNCYWMRSVVCWEIIFIVMGSLYRILWWRYYWQIIRAHLLVAVVLNLRGFCVIIDANTDWSLYLIQIITKLGRLLQRLMLFKTIIILLVLLYFGLDALLVTSHQFIKSRLLIICLPYLFFYCMFELLKINNIW